MEDKILKILKSILKISVYVLIFLIIFFLGFVSSYLLFNGWEVFPPSNKITDFQTLGIWIGSLGSLLAFAGVIISTKIQIKKNTDNLQSQIRNQNKEMHRPYISIISIDKECDDLNIPSTNEEARNKFNKENKLENQPSFTTIDACKFESISKYEFINKIVCSIYIENLGKGIACNVLFVPLDNAKFDSGTSIFITRDNHISKDLIVGRPKHITFNVNCTFKNNKGHNYIEDTYDELKFLLMYSDVHGYVYSTYISVKFIIFELANDNWTFKVQSYDCNQNNKLFYEKLKECNENYDEIVKYYKEMILSDKIARSE